MADDIRSRCIIWMKNLNYVRNFFDTYIKINYNIICFQFYLGEGHICLIQFRYKTKVLAHVIAVFKKGDYSLPSNYRPISLISCVGKIMERVIYKHVYNYLHQNRLIYISQYAQLFLITTFCRLPYK
jgi:hypothetical protein